MESEKQNNTTGHPDRRAFKRYVVGALVLSILGTLYALLVHKLPNVAIDQIGRLTQTDLKASSITLNLNGAVEIRDLTILPREESLLENPILKADRVRVKFSRASLFLLKPKIKHVLIHNFLLDAQFNKDVGLWNIEGMAINTPKTGKANVMPAIVLENGVLRYSTFEDDFIDVLASIPVDATFELNEVTEKGRRFQINTASIYQNRGQSELTGHWKPGSVELTGGLSSRDTPSMERVWSIGHMAAWLEYDDEKNFTLQTSIVNVRSRLNNLLPAWPQNKPQPRPSSPIKVIEQFFARYQPSGSANLEAEITGNLNRLAESDYVARLNCLDVSILDRAFYYPIDHLAGLVTFEKGSISAESLDARHNATPLQIQLNVDTSVSPARYRIQASSDQLPLDVDLYDALSDQHKELWKRFNPNGLCAVEYIRTRRSPAEVEKKLSIEMKDTQVTYLGFPYPLNNLTGTVVFDQGRVDFTNVLSQVANQQIAFNGFMVRQPAHNDFHLDITAQNVPLDDSLGRALPEKIKTGYDQLKMSGQTDATVSVRPDPNRPGQVTIHADLSLKDATLHVLDKQLPLTQSSGQVALSARGIGIRSLKGLFYDDPFSVQGFIELDEESRPTLYDLAVASPGLAIDSVTQALPDRPVQIIKKFQPQGKIGFQANLRRIRGTEELLCNAVVDCNGLTIEPQPYPYTLHMHRGKLTIDNEQLRFDDVWALPISQVNERGRNEKIGLCINGEALMTGSRFKSGQFKFSGHDLVLEKQLSLAMPAQMASCYESLAPSGRLNIEPSHIKITSGENNTYHVDYGTSAAVSDCNLTLIGSDAQFEGSFRATGHYNTESGLQMGSVSFNPSSVRVKGKKATNLTATVQYNAKKKQWASQDILADFYGGRISGQLRLGLKNSDRPENSVQLSVSGASLQSFLMDSPKESARTQKPSVGTINGFLSAITPLSPEEPRIGRCMFTITGMEVGKVSPLSKLLAALAQNKTSDYAFETMKVNSFIQGDTLHIEQLDLSGDVALTGNGTISLPGEALDLLLTARGNLNPSPLQSLTDGLFGTVMRIGVEGTLDDPEIITHMPVIEDPLKLLGSPED